MEILFDTISVLEALYDFQISTNAVAEQTVVVYHNYDKTKDAEILTEGVKDILNAIIDGIKAFIAKIKELLNKCFMTLNSYTMEYEKIVEKYGAQISDKKIEPFEIEGFTFTTLIVNKPNDSVVYDIVEEFNNDIVKFNRYSSEHIRTMCAEAMSPSRLNRLRGNVLGNDVLIQAQDFKKYVYSYYRNGFEAPTKMTIDNQVIKSIVDNNPKLLSEKKAAKLEKDTLMNALNRMEKFFSVKVASLYDDVQKTYNVSALQKTGYTADESRSIEESKLADLTSYMNMRYQQVVELSNIISVIYVERMAAIKDQINQNSQILRMVIRKSGVVAENKSIVSSVIEEANIYPPTPNPNWAPILDGVSVVRG